MNNNLFDVYRDKKVLITGHTGFKGSWMSQWLLELGAEVHGYGLNPPTSPSIFEDLKLSNKINDYRNDIRDFDTLKKCIERIKPDIIFHLAAQSLVRESYINPLETIESNISGTAKVLEAVRLAGISTNVIVATSDKCYENKEWLHGYRENDPMGGYDPYSVSKGAAELIVSAWRRSFFNIDDYSDHGVKLASVRAGNVIGGGDWADNRIVPDCIRALQQNNTISVRNPLSRRPWQHVLEPLGAYLLLGARMLSGSDDELESLCTGFNFGPSSTSNRSVEDLVESILQNWGAGNWTSNGCNSFHEAHLLNLNTDKAFHALKWKPVWDFDATVAKTVEWYRNRMDHPDETLKITEKQIHEYSNSFIPNYDS